MSAILIVASSCAYLTSLAACCTTIQVAYTLAWSKVGAHLSPNAEDDARGILTIHNVTPRDAGRYVCTGSNQFALDSDEAVLVVSGRA